MSDQEPIDEATSDAPAPEPAPVTPEHEPEPEPVTPEPVTERLEPATPAPRRLERSREDRVIAGVCGGVGEYFGVDAVLIRIAALVLVFAGGAGILLYLIGWVAMPEAADTESPLPDTPPEGAPFPGVPADRTPGAVVLGLVFVALGAFFLADEIWSDFLSWKYVWPVALIAVGGVVILRARR
jgi:phage shock protein PspC (stress-responsive transcriptional regulator)